MPKKTIGWILIASGLLIIALGLCSTLSIFIGKKAPPEVFKMETPIAADKGSKSLSQEELQKEMVSEQIAKIIPEDVVYKTLNLISWSIFATILFFGGGKIATIGISMLKN